MTSSLYDSPLFAGLFATGDARRLFTDSAAVRAMLLVEGALAQAQGKLGVIPELSAAAIHRASLEIQIDPGALATSTAQNGVPVPGLVAAFRREMNAPEHAQYVHWGATSQDIMDTALMLRLRQALVIVEQDLKTIAAQLGTLAQRHADLPMAARTWGQHATPTSFGAVVAAWGAPLLGLLDELETLRATTLWVSLSGAAGTSAALGPLAADQRAALAQNLGLIDPKRSWHTDRAPILSIAGWMTRCAVALGKLAQDVIAMMQTGISEISIGEAGASSTMPQKQNPVAPSVMVSIAHQISAANGALHSAGLHQYQRDATAWFTEWALLPQIVMGLATTLQHGCTLSAVLEPDAEQMRAGLETGFGLIHAEALSFALAELMPRPEAQQITKDLCKAALSEQRALKDIALTRYPTLAAQVFDPIAQMGQAPAEARAFAARCNAYGLKPS
jgi:3-carboxy-cis,cis-muconate cycloisomerase